MSSKNYYIFRHGETHATKTKRWYWHRLYSATILDEGKPSVIRLANYLKKIKTDYNVSSPFIRCRQTADLVSEITGKKFDFDPRIGERVVEWPWSYEGRIRSFIKDMEASDHHNILICTHAAVIRKMISYLTQGDISRKERVVAPNPGVLSIIKNGEIEEIDFNQI